MYEVSIFIYTERMSASDHVDIASKESKIAHICISLDSWEYIGNESSVVEKEEGRRCSKSSRRL